MIPAFVTIPFSFSLFLMLLLLLGESYLRWYFLGFFALLLLLFAKKLDFSWVEKQKKPLFLWGGFLGSAFISLFFTHSLPLSLESLAFYLFSFLVFVVSFSVRFKGFKKQQFSFYLVFVGFILSLLSLFFFFNRQLAGFLPGMNLLYATYGHNHLAAFLLLVLPLGWREVLLSSKRDSQPLFLTTLLGVLLITFSLLISFGRVVLFLGILQLGFMWWFYVYSKKNWTSIRSVLRAVFPAVLLIFLLIFSAKVYFSYQASINENFVCPFPYRIAYRVCKPFNIETRPLYFGQAIAALKEYPLTGYGPGTFELISRKYRQLPYVRTAYAHNHFLDLGAEMGVFPAALFFWLIASLFWQAGKKAFSLPAKKGQVFTFNQALFIGACSLLVNAFFDFDWSFLGIFSLTLFFIGLILRDEKQTSSKAENLSGLVAFVSKTIAYILLFFTVMYVLLETLIASGKTLTAFNIFPYFKEHFKAFETEKSSFSDGQEKRFLSLYRYHPTAYFFNREYFAEERFQEVRKNLFTIDPWESLYTGDIERYLNSGDFATADQHLTALIEVMTVAEEDFGYQFGFAKKFSLMEQRLAIADYYFEQGDPEKTAAYYLWAQSIEPWILDHRLPPVTESTPIDILERFLLAVDNGQPLLWGNNYQTFLDWHIQVFTQALVVKDEERAQFWFEFISYNFAHTVESLWNISSEHFADSLNQAVGEANIADIEKNLSIWFALWELYGSSDSTGVFDEHERQLASALLSLSQLMAQADNQPLPEQTRLFQTGVLSTAALGSNLQSAADDFLMLERNDWAELAIKLLREVGERDYWFAAQLGHFYTLLYNQAETAALKDKWEEKATQAYDFCLSIFAGDHYECTAGKQAFQTREFNVGRYYQVSQIIRGEKRWQDFSD